MDRMPASGRVIEVSDDERRVLLRLLDAEWWRQDRESDANDTQLVYMRDLEALQEKLK